MAYIDIKYGFIVNLTSTLAISKFDGKKGIFFISYQQTSKFQKEKHKAKSVGGSK
jgi:hypothetical protein